jgi:hypothetical protein
MLKQLLKRSITIIKSLSIFIFGVASLFAGVTSPAFAASSQWDISWVDNSANEEGFIIERKTDGEYLLLATLGANTTSYTEVDGIAGQANCYRVGAFNQAGSSYSGEACIDVAAEDTTTEDTTTEDTTATIVVQSRVSASEDDAEEYPYDGSISLNSSDLELVEESSTQTVGMRFSGLEIPENATITKAYIQFKADETDNLPDALFDIVGESTANASSFDDTGFNISYRTQTSESVSWSPASWSSVGATGAEQRTSDLTSIVQEVVSTTGWDSGNAMAFIFTGSGKRVAESYDGDQDGAPLLYVEYTY